MTAKTLPMDALIPAAKPAAEGSAWRGIYRASGTAALLAVLVGLLDTFITFLPGTGVTTPGTRTVIDWFTLFQNHWFLGLRELGLLNIVTTSCTVLVFYALYISHRRDHQAAAGLALILICMGTTIYIANNTAFSMLTLSRQYAAAGTESQKSLLLAAGQTLLAQEDISAGSFMGFFIPEVAGILMAIVMLRGRIFSQWAAWAGILGEAFLVLFNIIAAFVPALMDTAMIFAMVGGILSLAWLALIARRFFQL